MPSSQPADARLARRHQPLVAVAIAAGGGIALDRYFSIPYALWWGAAVVGVVAWLVFRKSGHERITAALLLSLCAAVGGLRHHAAWYLFADDDLGRFAEVEPQAVVLEAVVAEMPRTVAPSSDRAVGSVVKSRFKIRALRIREADQWRSASGVADVQVDGAVADVAAGDRVSLVGRISRPAPPLNPGEFDFAAHYRADRKLCVVRLSSPDSIQLLERGTGWNLAADLAKLRGGAQAWLLRHIPADQVGFASALLLGYRDLLDRRDNLAFFRTGTVHILSISGLHIGILAWFLHVALRLGWLKANVATSIVLGVTIVYALVIDAEPPALRAVIVVATSAMASFARRRALSLNLLAASALVVLWINPCDLFRAGPQLSFLAAGVLAWNAERSRKPDEADAADALDRAQEEKLSRRRLWLRRQTRRFGRGLIVSTAIFVVTTPLVAQRFHILSPISLLLTPLLSIPITLALLFGFLTLTLGWLVPSLAPLLGIACGGMLRLIEYVVQTTQHWPGASIWLPGPSLAATATFYVMLAAWVALEGCPRARRAVGAAALIGITLAMIPHQDDLGDAALRTTFVGVGHGLAVVIESRDGGTTLYDCGKLGSADGAARAVSSVLWSRGITRLERIIISHGDADHYNGLPQLLDQFRVGEVCISTNMASGDVAAGESSALRFIRQATEQAGVPLREIEAGDRLSAETAAAEIRVLRPAAGERFESDNAESIVLELSAGGRRILLTGDLEADGLAKLLAEPPLDCDVVLAPHHGSARSNPPGLARWSTPEWVVVSGRVDGGSSVLAAYRAVGAEVLQTSEVGAVTATIDRATIDRGTSSRPGALRVTTFRR